MPTFKDLRIWQEAIRLMFRGVRLMGSDVGKDGEDDSGSKKCHNSVDHVVTPFEIK